MEIDAVNNNVSEIIRQIANAYNKNHSVRSDVFCQQPLKREKHRSNANFKNVGELISAIVHSYHRNWDKEKLEFARNFLSKTWAGFPLPVLSICGRGTQEIRYSKYLAYFLDQSKSHGIGRRLLNGLLAFLNMQIFDTYQAIVETEKWLGYVEVKQKKVNSYCDILITSTTHIIFIEQKIDSGESNSLFTDMSQLLRYDAAIQNNPEFSGKRHIKIYLTPTGKISQKSPDWLNLSYIDLVNIGINVMHSGELSGNARDNLIRFLLDIAIGPFHKEENTINEIVKLAEKAVISNSFVARLNFDQLVNRNRALVRLLMEG